MKKKMKKNQIKKIFILIKVLIRNQLQLVKIKNQRKKSQRKIKQYFILMNKPKVLHKYKIEMSNILKNSF